MRAFVALTPVAVVLAAVLVLPSCSDSSPAAATDGTPTQIYTGSSCTPTTPETVNADYYAMTRELDPASELVELTEVTE